MPSEKSPFWDQHLPELPTGEKFLRDTSRFPGLARFLAPFRSKEFKSVRNELDIYGMHREMYYSARTEYWSLDTKVTQTRDKLAATRENPNSLSVWERRASETALENLTASMQRKFRHVEEFLRSARVSAAKVDTSLEKWAKKIQPETTGSRAESRKERLANQLRASLKERARRSNGGEPPPPYQPKKDLIPPVPALNNRNPSPEESSVRIDSGGTVEKRTLPQRRPGHVRSAIVTARTVEYQRPDHVAVVISIKKEIKVAPRRS